LKPVDCWLLSVGSEATKRQYLFWLKRFCEFSKSTPKQLVLKARRDVARNTNEVDTLVKRFYNKLIEESYTEGSAQAATFSIRSFYTHNNIRLPKLGKKFSVRFQPAFEARRVITKEELLKMLSNTKSDLESLVLKFLAQTGQRRGIVSALRLSNIKDTILPLPEPDKIGPLLFSIPPVIKDKYGFNTNKTRNAYRFAVSDILAREIVHHLRMREAAGEVLTKDSWLFADIGGRALYGDKIRMIVNKAATRAGIQTFVDSKKKGKMASIHAHIFRDHFKKSMRETGVFEKYPQIDRESFLDMCLGHVERFGFSYDRISDDTIRQIFKDAGPFLS